MNPAIKTIVLPVLFLLFSFSSSCAASFYHWVDQNGTYHFTDDYERIPSAYRSQARLRTVEEASEADPPALPATPKAAFQKEAAKRDIFGIGEDWWRERVRPWRAQLKEARENFEGKGKEVLEESKMLEVRKFGSHQQFKFALLGMDRARQERDRHEARLTEAREILNRIARDADESGADRAWLNGASPLRQTDFFNTAGNGAVAGDPEEAWRKKQTLERQEQLKDAVNQYEEAYEKYSRSIEELGPWRFGRLSLTQYQMLACRLDLLSSEMARHQARITEASERLRELLTETGETRIPSGWAKQ